MAEDTNLARWVDKLKDARVLVLGDVMLDRFVSGHVSRISPEAPIPVLTSVETRTELGGAGNVVNNLAALGAQVDFIGAVGQDPEASEIEELLKRHRRVKSVLLPEEGRKTTVKTRFLAERQQVLRVDQESVRPLSEKACSTVLRHLGAYLEESDVVVLSDYGKGFLSDNLLPPLIQAVRRHQSRLLVDPKGKDFGRYSGASILTPNLKELSEATDLPTSDDRGIVHAARKLISNCDLKSVLVTRSQKGMSLVPASGPVQHFPARAREVFDVSGAGDTVIATFAATLAAGSSPTEAAELANIAAGLAVAKVGTAVVYPVELNQVLRSQELRSAEAKIVGLNAALDKLAVWRRKGLKIGFTNGLFDLLHEGHLRLLDRASEVCDRLIVGLNGDRSVKTLRNRAPIQREAVRSRILASLEAVDMVILFQEETPVSLLAEIRPDVLLKGSNYRPEEVVGADLVKDYGGEVVIVELDSADNSNLKDATLEI